MTSTAPQHPSYLALDRAALGSSSEDVERHVKDCAECRAYLQTLAEPPPGAGWLEVQQKLAQRRVVRQRSWWAAAPLAAAALALLFVAVQRKEPSGREDAPYVGIKGFPSVWIYVKHETDTKLWDGKRAFHPGDRLRLKVDPGTFRRIAVYSAKGEAPPELLYESDVMPGQISTLPEAWELDAEPGAEKLFVVLSDEPRSPQWTEWQHGMTANGLSVLTFTLPKSMAVDASDGGP